VITACVDRLAEIGFGGLLHLLQDEGGDLRRADSSCRLTSTHASPLLALDDAIAEPAPLSFWVIGIVEAAADKALDREDGVVWIGDGLALRGLPDQTLTILGERNRSRASCARLRNSR